MNEMKVCNKCGKMLPIENFRLMNNNISKPYHLGQCKKCEYECNKRYKEVKNRLKISDNIEILVKIKYKEIKQERVLNISDLNISLIAEDEIFVKLMDYDNIWLSNYGRAIKCCDGEYKILFGTYDKYGVLRYHVRKNVYSDGKWVYKKIDLHAAKAVVDEFVVNPDKRNNTYIWHKGFNKKDCYYKHLYPVNMKQYYTIKNHFNKTGDDSEKMILYVINAIQYKPDTWNKRVMKPTMCGVGYHGCGDYDIKSTAYIKWHDMLNRCYNKKFHERCPQYKKCSVCDEWQNFSNFEVWYNENKYGDKQLDLDKDILFKGNFIYSPETVVLVPHSINTLFINGLSSRGDCPVGVYYDENKKRYRANVNSGGEQKKLGEYKTAEEAFNKYKEFKESIIKDMAERYKGEIPYKAYEAMMNWKIEIDD